jgi:hypothetical protein
MNDFISLLIIMVFGLFLVGFLKLCDFLMEQ